MTLKKRLPVTQKTCPVIEQILTRVRKTRPQGKNKTLRQNGFNEMSGNVGVRVKIIYENRVEHQKLNQVGATRWGHKPPPG